MLGCSSRVHVVACGVLAIDIQRTAERLGLELTTEFLEGGLHARPGELRRRLQAAIDQASASGSCDRIAVGYGICGRGTVGIQARGVPLVLPRAQDCIALFLGSDAAYREEFARVPGTYYISAGWFEEKVQPRARKGEPAAKPQGQGQLEELAAKYGEDNARAIVEFLTSWQRNYQRAAFIDTGAPGRERYAAHAQAMAAEFGWRYEALPGDLALLETMLTASASGPEVVVVPPHHATAFDPLEGRLTAVPVWRRGAAAARGKAEGARSHSPSESHRQADGRPRLGLGIDAGGTYTDAVVFDFDADAVLEKSKALTTRWHYTLGIDHALAALDPERLAAVGLVAVSTTLATNAIVEGQGQKVGLLLMPPYGLFHPSDVPHEPKAVLTARLEIDGGELAPVDGDEVRRVAREMVAAQGVGAFAVSGYGGTVNPAHELAVKAIVREATGLSVTCGHELSALLNFRTRADTAVLNARIIPRLETLLRQVEGALRARGIDAPVMVVKCDGTLMSADTARQRPIETILSGPAASVAGARHLTRCADALVVDVGGTTTDTAAVRGGAVRICADGARVGRWKTHVRALDMRTIGLGGDSLVAFERQRLTVGPRRVAPVAWLAAERAGTALALDYLEAHLDDYAASTRAMELVALTGSTDGFEPGPQEGAIIRALRERPCSAAELAERTGAAHWQLLRLERLEDSHVVQRAALTPTDLLHALGRFERWHAEAARRLCEMVARVAGLESRQLADQVLEQVTRTLAVELLKKQLDEEADPAAAPEAGPDAMDDCPACQSLVANLLAGGSADYTVRVTLKRPIIGLGAPAHCFVPEAARRLHAQALVPPDADVANAIGAITSLVVVARQATVRPNDRGRYAVHGLAAARDFRSFDEAHAYATHELAQLVRTQAREAGTAETRVEMETSDHIATAADGQEIFLERVLTARIAGPPEPETR